MEQTDRKRIVTGILITMLAGFCWGFSGTCAQFLFLGDSITPVGLVAWRQLLSGGIMVLIAFLRYRKDLLRMLRNPKDVVILVIFSIAGLMFIQVSFIEAIAYTNSGTATILQYTGLVLIMIVNCIIARRLPQKKEVLSVLLVIVATIFLLAQKEKAPQSE
ncbi:MAG: DMT family transporter [Eubacterium sp.]|nr:DMT family transporter [Eubacterium sp.]